VHTALQLAAVLAAEKSKVPFYIAGGVLVVWALGISMAVGMRRVRFPENDAQQRGVMAISAVLVAVVIGTAVVTGSAPEKEAQAASGETTSTAATAPAPEAAPSSTATAPAPAHSGKGQPTATTGTPAPPSSPAAKPTKLALAADPGGGLAFDTTKLSAKAGPVSIDFANASPVEHNVTIAQGSKILGATPTFVGGRRTLTVKLTPGSYLFYCSVPGHKQAGMEGTLTVSP
jgi:plastocyanin